MANGVISLNQRRIDRLVEARYDGDYMRSDYAICFAYEHVLPIDGVLITAESGTLNAPTYTVTPIESDTPSNRAALHGIAVALFSDLMGL